MKRARSGVAILVLTLIALQASADPLPAGAWPPRADAALHELGSGVGIVFSPDLTVAGTCDFYSLLGFLCIADADWKTVVERIAAQNATEPANAIRTVVFETHGTNGNGLKLQEGPESAAMRSYISVGALQERLDSAGVRFAMITACNAGRLVRPKIYRRLDRNTGDRLFLPATGGIVDASDTYDVQSSRVTILSRTSSKVEMMVVARLDELAPSVQLALRSAAAATGRTVPEQFVVSDFMMQLMAGDSGLDVGEPVPTEKVSGARTSAAESELLFARFAEKLEQVALAARTH